MKTTKLPPLNKRLNVQRDWFIKEILIDEYKATLYESDG